MRTGELLQLLDNYAKEYHKGSLESLIRNRHMNNLTENEELDLRHIDAVLVDFINYIGVKNGVDYAMYTKDLKNNPLDLLANQTNQK